MAFRRVIAGDYYSLPDLGAVLTQLEADAVWTGTTQPKPCPSHSW